MNFDWYKEAQTLQQESRSVRRGTCEIQKVFDPKILTVFKGFRINHDVCCIDNERYEWKSIMYLSRPADSGYYEAIYKKEDSVYKFYSFSGDSVGCVQMAYQKNLGSLAQLMRVLQAACCQAPRATSRVLKVLLEKLCNWFEGLHKAGVFFGRLHPEDILIVPNQQEPWKKLYETLDTKRDAKRIEIEEKCNIGIQETTKPGENWSNRTLNAERRLGVKSINLFSISVFGFLFGQLNQSAGDYVQQKDRVVSLLLLGLYSLKVCDFSSAAIQEKKSLVRYVRAPAYTHSDEVSGLLNSREMDLFSLGVMLFRILKGEGAYKRYVDGMRSAGYNEAEKDALNRFREEGSMGVWCESIAKSYMDLARRLTAESPAARATAFESFQYKANTCGFFRLVRWWLRCGCCDERVSSDDSVMRPLLK